MERRVSPRTKANVPLAISRGKITYTARCVELSQTGLLARGPAELFDTPWQYASARLILGSGTVKLVLRKVAVRGEHFACSLTPVDDEGLGLLTDFLFERLHQTFFARPRRKAAAR
jgi:hypothetical protein